MGQHKNKGAEPHILIVEDHPDLQLCLAEFAQTFGLRALAALDLDQAHRQLDAYPDVAAILLDGDLGRGQQAADLIPRIADVHAQYGTLVVTMSSCPDTRQRHMASGAKHGMKILESANKWLAPEKVARTLGLAGA